MTRTNGVALLLLGTLALTGCSAHANAETTVRLTGLARLAAVSGSGAPVMVAPRAGATTDDLRAALLSDADIPGGGFTPVAVATSHNGKVSIGGGSFPGCPALEPMTTDQTVSAAVTYAKGAMGPYLTDAVVRFPAGQATEALKALRSTTTDCKSFEQQLAGITVRFTLAATSLPAGLGDEAVGLRMTGTTDIGVSVTADIVAARRGDYVLWLNDTAIGTDSAGLAASLAPAAAKRCTASLPGC
ncbi:hypothetical protein Dvina_22560 [Dactylosporangium vinaceum]|uniref:PknH-like extracellular domain-containing protein n=1 Tax=Dactylosporangium vinaceum TaxID=53362 RepID=A0ABV5M798_9ACTN|nr:hypothetical protein [Dactylosporangium vinaceum]UAC00585.1 hypothetical protein Dvina_22560 [Dactylosporangium vinaceum]